MASVARRVSNALTTNESSKTQPFTGQQRKVEVQASNSPPQKERDASTKQKNTRGTDSSSFVNYAAADQCELLTSMPTLNPMNVKNTHLLSLIDALKREARELKEEVDVKNQTIITLANSLYETDSALHLARASEKNHEEQRQMFTTELVEMKNTSNTATALREKIVRLESDLATAEQLFASPLRSELDLLRQQREADDAKLLDWKNKVKEALKESKRKEQTLADERAALAEKLEKAELKVTELGFELERLNNNVGGIARKGRPCDYGTMTDEVTDEQWLFAQRGLAVGGDGRMGVNSPLSLAGLNVGGAESQLPRHADLQRQFGHLIPSAAEILAPLFEYEPSSAAIANAKDPQAAAYAVASFRLAQQLAPAGTCFLYAGGGDASNDGGVTIGSDITHTSLFTAAMHPQQRPSQGRSGLVVASVADGKRSSAVHNFLQSPTMGPTSAFNFNGSIANPSGHLPAPQSTTLPKAPPPLLSPHTPHHTLSAAAATMMTTSNDGYSAFGGMVESPTTHHSSSSAEASPSFASALKPADEDLNSLVTAADNRKNREQASAAREEDENSNNGADRGRKGGVVHVITSNNNNYVANSTSNSRGTTPTPSYQTQILTTAPTGPATGVHPAHFQYDAFHNNTSLTSAVGGVPLPPSTNYTSNNRTLIIADGTRSPRLEPGATSPLLDPRHGDYYDDYARYAGSSNNNNGDHHYHHQRMPAPLHPDPPSVMAIAEAAQIPRYPYYAPDGIERSTFLGLSPLQQRVIGMARRYFYGLLERDKAKQLHPTSNSSGHTHSQEGEGGKHFLTFSGGGSGSVAIGFPLGSPASASKTFAVVGAGGSSGGGSGGGGSKAASSSPSTSSPFSPTSGGAGSAQLPPASAIDLYADLLSGSKKITLKKSTPDGGPSPMSSTTTTTTLGAASKQQRKGTVEAEALPFIVTVRFSGTQQSAAAVSEGSDPPASTSDSPSSPSPSAWSLDAKMLVKPGMSVFDLIVSCCSKFSMRYDSSLEPNNMALAIHHDPSRRRITLAPHRDVHSFTYIAKKAQDGQNVVLSLIHKNPLAESVERVMDTMV